MELAVVGERAELTVSVRADRAAEPRSIMGVLRAVTELRSWLAAAEADLTSRLESQVSFPEQAIADFTTVLAARGGEGPGASRHREPRGRTTRLASAARRRALRALRATCAIPGCSVLFDRCKIHHVIWWRHGGRTDLANLLPICAHHQGRVRGQGWQPALGPNHERTLTLPDGTVHDTGPRNRRAA